MTCVVAIVDTSKNIHMGSDSLATDSHSQTTMTTPKLFMLGEMLVGFAGSFRSAQVLQYQIALPDRTELQSDMEYLVASFMVIVRDEFIESGLVTQLEDGDEYNGEFLLGYRGKLYRMQNDFSLLHATDDFVSIGAGGEAARAVLHATKNLGMNSADRLKVALESSEYQISSVQRPFHYIHVDQHGEDIVETVLVEPVMEALPPHDILNR